MHAGRISEILEGARICIEEGLNVNHKNLKYYVSQPGMLVNQWAKDLIKLIKYYGPDSIPIAKLKDIQP